MTKRVVVATPLSARDVGLATKELVLLLGLPNKNVTGVLLVSPAKVAVMVVVWATALLMVTEHTPEAFVLQVAALKGVLTPPLLAKVTAWLLTALPVASSTVICKLDVVMPSSGTDDGVAVSVLLALLATPVTNVTFAILEKPANVAVTVTVAATVLLKVTEHCPLLAVAHVVALKVVPGLGLPAKVTA